MRWQGPHGSAPRPRRHPGICSGLPQEIARQAGCVYLTMVGQPTRWEDLHAIRLVIIVSAVLSVALVGSAVLVAPSANALSEHQARKDARQFVGYWMGIDPLDGGDSRRGITRNDDGTFSMIGRDTVFSLCDDTDRAVITLSDGIVVDSALVGDLVITCLNDGSIVTLNARYDVLDRNIVSETVTRQEGEFVDEIIFHRVSDR